jgi:hypothetical protein
MKNSTTATAKQIRLRINQLNNLISKFPRVRSLVRKWGFELTILEGRLESLKAVAVVETPKQLTIWDIAPMNLTHGLTDKKLNYWEDDTHTHLIQETPTKTYVYYRNHLVVDCGTPKELARTYGFTLTGN